MALISMAGTPADVAKGLVSVMMPAYNAEAFIARSIESVLAQTYANWELIIVDDGSTDRTADIAAAYKDSRISLRRQPNSGESVARNTALDHMTGEFVAFLDADDEYLPEHLQVTCAYLAGNFDRDGVYTDGYYCDKNGTRLQTLSSRRRGPFEGTLFEELIRASDVFGPPICVVLRRHAITDRDFRYDPSIVIGPDWEFFTRVAQIARFGYLDAPTCLYRVHQTNITVRIENDKRAMHLARCREKAIQLEGFADCSSTTRSAVFYDLLVNLLPGRPDRQTEVLNWPQFDDLPAAEKGRLVRLMASTEIRRSGDSPYVRDWLELAQSLNPQDTRTKLLAMGYGLSPRYVSVLLQARKSLHADRSIDKPFEGIAP